MIRTPFVLTPLIVLPLTATCGAEAVSEAADDPASEAQGESVADTTDAPDGAIAPEDAAALEAQVAALYDDPFSVDTFDPPLPMTDRFAALFAEERALVDAYDGVANLDFAWVIAGQDAAIANLAITHAPIGPGEVAVLARFDNFGEPSMVRYEWVRQGMDWLLDDIVVGADGDPAPIRLSQLLGRELE